jgi:tRNA modification GTPase
MRHYAALNSAHQALASALAAMDNNLPSDLISEDIRQVLHHLGEITGEVTSDDILHTIFSKFCIGK